MTFRIIGYLEKGPGMYRSQNVRQIYLQNIDKRVVTVLKRSVVLQAFCTECNLN